MVCVLEEKINKGLIKWVVKIRQVLITLFKTKKIKNFIVVMWTIIHRGIHFINVKNKTISNHFKSVKNLISQKWKGTKPIFNINLINNKAKGSFKRTTNKNKKEAISWTRKYKIWSSRE